MTVCATISCPLSRRPVLFAGVIKGTAFAMVHKSSYSLLWIKRIRTHRFRIISPEECADAFDECLVTRVRRAQVARTLRYFSLSFFMDDASRSRASTMIKISGRSRCRAILGFAFAMFASPVEGLENSADYNINNPDESPNIPRDKCPSYNARIAVTMRVVARDFRQSPRDISATRPDIPAISPSRTPSPPSSSSFQRGFYAHGAEAF